MNPKTLILNFVNRENEEYRPRLLGRYYASEIKSIIGGYLKPRDFFKPKKIDEPGMIVTGMAYEDMYKKILDYNKIKHEYNPKYELTIDDFIIVVKPDFVYEDRVEETKHPFSPRIDKYDYQLECEYRATNKPVFLVVLETPFKITHIPFKPDEDRWKFIQDTMRKFHEAVKTCNPEKSML